MVACALAVAEAVALVLQGLLLLPALEGDRLTMGLTSTLFFVLYGAGLAWCAWCLVRGQSWARAPVVLAQLIQVLLGLGFWGGDTTAVAVVLVRRRRGRPRGRLPPPLAGRAGARPLRASGGVAPTEPVRVG